MGHLDSMTWNTCGLRLPQVLKHIGKRSMVIALQEVRPPKHTAWAGMCGYMVVCEERADAQSCCAIAVRNDVLKHYKLNVNPRGEALDRYRLGRRRERDAFGLRLHPHRGQQGLQRRGDGAQGRVGAELRYRGGRLKLEDDEGQLDDHLQAHIGHDYNIGEHENLETKFKKERDTCWKSGPILCKR